MIKIQKQQETPITVIRAASGSELTEYEKNKLAGIEEKAQQNKLESIRINDVKVPIDTETKTANIKLGALSFKNTIAPEDVDGNALFFIKCSLE